MVITALLLAARSARLVAGDGKSVVQPPRRCYLRRLSGGEGQGRPAVHIAHTVVSRQPVEMPPDRPYCMVDSINVIL
jgi:hypothetical protein